MARRKKSAMLDDGSDSDSGASSDHSFNSQEDEDSRAERALFERKHKRPRTGGKQAAWEGIFGEEEPQPRFRGRGGIGGSGRGKTGDRADWTKAPSFVASGSKPVSEDVTPAPGSEDSGSESGSGSDEEEDEDTGADSTRPATPRVVDADEDEPPRRMGMGMGMGAMKAFMAGGSSEPAQAPSSSGRTGRMGLGAMKSMFDSGRKVEDERVDAETKPEDAPKPKEVPSAFGRSASAFSAFKSTAEARGNFTKSASPAPAPQTHTLTGAERAHFSKISSSFGARMLANMGWAPGKGLGADESGLAVPIAVKVMQRGQGIASGIRSEESKREARRKGELVDDEPKEKRRGGKKGPKEPRVQRDGWKKEKRVKVKVEHKTYEQLIAEEDTTRAGMGLVLDARGGELKAVESLSELSLSTWTPSTDTMQLPELRHNLRLIFDVAKGEVTNLVKEGKAVNEKRRWSTREEERARTKKESVEGEIARLESIQATVKEITHIAGTEARKGGTSLFALQEPFDALLSSKTEYAALGLDDVVVAAIDQVLNKAFASWRPFDISSDALLSALKPWRRAFNLDSQSTGTMTAWESVLWNRWLPKVRSAINNEWEATDPLPAVHLFESWETLLPAFIRDNLIDQLILPKVLEAVERWRPKHQSLASIIFPWLPLLGDHVADILDEGKRRIRAVLRKWNPQDGVISELERWRKDVFQSSEWDKLMGEHVLPKLGAVLRDDFTINPRAQDMQPLQLVLPWSGLIRASNFARLFELEFFPKWLNVLYLWLVHPGYSGDEVAQWFEMWKGVFPADALANPAIAHGFDAGLRLMDEALELGADAPTKLRKPDFQPLPSKKKVKSRNGTPKFTKPRTEPTADITFRSIAEEYVAANDLVMFPLGKSHPTTGKPLFRVGKNMDKGGVVVYVGEDAVFAQEEGSFRAIALDDLVKRASV